MTEFLGEIGVKFMKEARGNVSDDLYTVVMGTLDEFLKSVGIVSGVLIRTEMADGIVPFLMYLNKTHAVFGEAFELFLIVFCGCH